MEPHYIDVCEADRAMVIRLNRVSYVIRAIEGAAPADFAAGIRTVSMYLTYEPHLGKPDPRSIIVRFSHREKVLRLG